MDGRRADPVLFDDLYAKPTRISFDEPTTSSDGGVILLDGADRLAGLTDVFVRCIDDPRQPGKIGHSVGQLLRQRIFGIACGYGDCNDAARLASDPMMRLASGRSVEDESDTLASQPTLSRFENSLDATTQFRIGCGLAERVVDYHRRRRRGRRKPRLITIDLDPTDDATHGQQEFAFYHGHYRSWCYLPAAMFLTFDQEPTQHLVGAALRPGDAHPTRWAPCMIRRLVAMLRESWPNARLRVRLDGGYATPNLLDWLEYLGVEYLVGMPTNKRLKGIAEPLMKQARAEQRRTGETARRFGESWYATRSWNDERRIIIKAEVTVIQGREPRDNCRFLVTNLRHNPENVYRIYRKRGDIENRIKELLDGVDLGRTSCTSFLANSFRVLLSAAAYVLFQVLRDLTKNPDLRRAQVWTLRERLLKVAARVRVTWRRLHIALPESYIWADAFRRLAIVLRARPAPPS
jgi:hypothetical protein